MSKRKKLALVIGWGSVKCAAALGLLRVLRREGIEVDMVVASGGGSIYGSLFALGYEVEERSTDVCGRMKSQKRQTSRLSFKFYCPEYSG